MEQEDGALPISYHTFMFPFIWKNNFKNGKEYTAQDFVDLLNKKCWKENTSEEPGVVPFTAAEYETKKDKKGYDPEINSDSDKKIRFAAIQYFHKPVLSAMFPSKTEVVKTLSFLPGQLLGNSKYCIKKDPKEKDLDLNAIRLKIYNTGVAVLIFEVENYSYKKIEDIKFINDYGRRISLPFIPEEGAMSLTADSIGILLKKGLISSDSEEQLISTDFRKDIDNINEITEKTENIKAYSSKANIAKIITDILFYGKEGTFIISNNSLEPQSATDGKTEDDKTEDNKIKIFLEPILDDRMFVACLIRNDPLTNEIKTPKFSEEDADFKEWKEINGKTNQKTHIDALKAAYAQTLINNQGYAYQHIKPVDGSVAGKLYSIIAVDPADSSCQDRFMVQDLLKKSVYSRWIEYGTIQAVTHHSLFCITGETKSITANVLNPFLTQYIEMMLLVLVQRATIIQFEHMAAQLSKGIGSKKGAINIEDIKILMDLQEKFVAFQNELLFFEVTAQEQGIELYELMQKQLYINEEIEKLNQHLSILYEATTVNQEYRFNMWAFIIAGSALILSLFTMFAELCTNGSGFWSGACLIIVAYFFGIMYLKFSRKNNRK